MGVITTNVKKEKICSKKRLFKIKTCYENESWTRNYKNYVIKNRKQQKWIRKIVALIKTIQL